MAKKRKVVDLSAALDERDSLARELFGEVIDERAFRCKLQFEREQDDWSRLPEVIEKWRAFPSRLIQAWEAVQKWWQCELQINPHRLPNGIPDKLVFWNWEFSGKQLALPPDGHFCRAELLRSWESSRQFIQARMIDMLPGASNQFSEVHARTFKMMTRPGHVVMAPKELWPDCLEPCIQTLPLIDRRNLDKSVFDARYLLECVAVRSSKTEDEAKANDDVANCTRGMLITNPILMQILRLLDGRAMRLQEIANRVTAGDPSRLYKIGFKIELLDGGLVSHNRGIGYYRPDSPPKELVFKKR